MKKQLLLGCGTRRNNLFTQTWEELVTLDINPQVKPDIVHDLMDIPLPLKDDTIDEIHAYEVLEHTGQQGDWRFFFRQFSDFWRMLKPGGMLYGTSPSSTSKWIWGDPGHSRMISSEALSCLSQETYRRKVGVTSMSDYRFIYGADFEPLISREENDTFIYALRAVKPPRI
jgi:hypothetical protein